MVKQSIPPTDNEIQTFLGDQVVESWNQEKVTVWLKEKGWEQFASTFREHDICRERFFKITLAELVEILPRTVTTYYERRRLLNEIRLLVPTSSGTKPLPLTTNISINTNIHDLGVLEGVDDHFIPPINSSPSDNTTMTPSATATTTTRDSGIGYFSHYSAGSSSSSPSPSPSSDSYHPLDKRNSPTTKSYSPIKSYSPKAAFNMIKNTFRSSAPMTLPTTTTTTPHHTSAQSPLSAWHESADDDRGKKSLPSIPTRVSSTPDKISKFWSTYAHWHQSNRPASYSQESTYTNKPTSQKIQITGDKETWYSLNVTNMRDPVAIKRHILKRMNYDGDYDQYQYFHENGLDPTSPMDPHELMYLCAIADHSANQRILVKPVLHFSFTPELGQSPTSNVSPTFKPLSRKTARFMKKPSLGIKLSDPPIKPVLIDNTSLWAVAPKKTPPLENKTEFWGERPPAEVVFQHMEQYFDSKDLDKEVVVIEPVTRKLTHTKSIRVVAREASRKYHSKSKNMLRRQSTKLWGQKVVEVKSRSSHILRLPSVSEHMRLSHQQTTGEEVQWIRGKLIGKGSFGRVYLAFNVGTGEVIAVKQVEIPKTASDLLNEHQHDMVESLYQEIMMLRDLDHENIVQYLGYGHDEAEGVINIFLDYVSGGSVASRLALHGAFDETLVKYFTRQICSGLEYLHSKHILHRDIKADNILVEVDGICKISDFGLSKKNDYDEVYDQNSRMSLRGSVYWMAPEVVKNEPYSAKVDIWSLGCTVLEMLTGQRPWLSMNQIAAIYNLGRLNSPTIPDTVSNCAKDFLEQCFVIDPSKRPTAADLLNHPFLMLDKSFLFQDYIDKGKV